jgi:hypothetical protein
MLENIQEKKHLVLKKHKNTIIKNTIIKNTII